MFLRLSILCFAFSIFTMAGCGSKGPGCGPAWEKNKQLFNENSDLKKQVAELQTQNTTLKQQVQTLSQVNPKQRLEELTRVESITLYKMTGLYSANREKPAYLAVYFTPKDAKGDAVKAAGNVEVELWNIADVNNAKIGAWQVGSDELSKSWGNTLLSAFYRLNFNLPANLPKQGDYILKVTFTDYLTGRIFKAEQILSQFK